MPSESSKVALSQILEALRDDNASMIGLYGMGGVGKTTLVKEVGKQVNKLKLFDKVLMVVVSQAQDYIQIQDQLADKLYLYLHEKSKEGRANRLWKSLKNEKKILIILDDVWKYLDLKDLGIPFGDDHKGCKILLTTRLQHVCTSMDCQREIPLHVLTEDEAWSLLKKNAGVGDDSSALTNMEMEVARQCKGLLIAIVTVGRALRGKNLQGWEVASRKLKMSKLTDIRDVNQDNNAYACLKLSFDYLQHDETKLCFLLCSLFPEDCEIFVEDLVRYAVGFGLYEDASSIEEARSEVYEAICDLQASCMLLQTESEEHMKMHDMVRDFALWVGSKVDGGFKLKVGIGLEEQQRTENFNKYTALSLMGNNVRELVDGSVCPKLEMLLLDRKRTQFSTDEDSSDVEEGSSETEGGSISVLNFEGMKELKVLSLVHEFFPIKSLEFLSNLQTLELKCCSMSLSTSRESSMDITSLRMLKKLKILSLQSSAVKELPEEIGELNNLRLLDLTGCQKLKRIPPNTIQRLSKLEELYIGTSSFRQWEVEGASNQRTNATLMELNSLSHLAALWLYINDKHIPTDFAFPSLKKYYMQINLGVLNRKYSLRPGNPISRSISIIPCNINTMSACKDLFLNVYDLELENNGTSVQNIIPDMDQRGFNHLIRLNLFLCRMDCLISTKQQQVPTTAFSNLQVIHIGKTSLTEICDEEPPQTFLEKLTTLEIFVSYGMITIFPSKLWKALQNLETVVLHGCEDVEVVFQLNGIEGSNKELLSRLMKLRLEYIPKLRYIWKGPTLQVNLKSLTYLKLDGCDRLTSIFSPCLALSLVQLETLDISDCNQLEQIVAENGEEAFAEACLQPLGLQNLKTLKIFGCSRLEYVFPISIARGLLHLEEVNIKNAAELKQFFSEGQRGVSSGEVNSNTLPQPGEYELEYSSNLSYFSSGNFAAALHYLQHVEFMGCPKLSMNSVVKLPALPKASTSSRQVRGGNLEGTQLKTLIITGCTELEHVIVKDDDQRHYLSLQNHIGSLCFTNLLHIRIYRCYKLKRLFPITIAQGLLQLKYFEVIEACQLLEIFEVDDEAGISDEKKIVVPKLVRLTLKELPGLVSFCPGGYHFVFSCLETLTVQACPLIITRFTVTPNCSVHAKTEKPQIVEQDIATGSPTIQAAAAAGPGSSNKDIDWKRSEQRDVLPPYMEGEDEAKPVQVVENSSDSNSRPTSMMKCRDLITKKKKKEEKKVKERGT